MTRLIIALALFLVGCGQPQRVIETIPTATQLPPTITPVPPTPLPTATPTPSGPLTTFGNGTWRVGIDIEPGTYRSTGNADCYWVRLSGFGGSGEEIIANGLETGPAVVTIQPTDAGFKTERCGDWLKQN